MTTTATDVVDELRAFLAEAGVPPLELDESFFDHVVPTRHEGPGHRPVDLTASQELQAALYDRGLAWLDGPPEYGGRGLDPVVAGAVRSVLLDHQLPDRSFFTVAHRIVGPTILAHGTDAQKERWLRALWRGDVLACQLFSEPEAGSDLAALRCTATRDGDDWVINGQKIWSSWAHLSAVGELLARTGAPGSRHRGITAFLLEMDAPGVTVRPIRQIDGGAHFCEVFLDGVRIPDSARLGTVDGGWDVAMTTLGTERTAMGSRDKRYLSEPYLRLRRLAGDVSGDTAAQEALAEVWLRERLAGTTGDRIAAGGRDAPSPSAGKLALVGDLGYYGTTAARFLGDRLAVDTGEPGTFAWSEFVLGSLAQRIAGGTDQIQRNIVAERVLGLPREPAPAPAATPRDRESTAR